MTTIDWDNLRAASQAAMSRAYAPYSGYPVGAAGLADDGRIVAGCNIENAGYGVTLCAECGMISELVLTGGGKLVAVTCCNGNGDIVLPCGRCRQLINEHGTPETLIDLPDFPRPLSEVLPFSFGLEDLNEVATSVTHRGGGPEQHQAE